MCLSCGHSHKSEEDASKSKIEFSHKQESLSSILERLNLAVELSIEI